MPFATAVKKLLTSLCVTAWVISFITPPIAADDFPEIVNSQPGDEEPPSAEEAARAITFPDDDPNWNVTLFAGEPDVQQPIAFDFDDRGRLWVAECFSYTSRLYDEKHGDRIVILEDTDGDGTHDVRKVFWDKGWMLTGLTYGYGGLWILNNGTLSFLPDADGDDIPDGEPEIMLDGWTFEAHHNVVNGLLWGPDGWLYGRHGITDVSYPGAPGTPKEERTYMDCGIWRFHPIRKVFEVVCRGTTNPWGLDYDEHGQMFFTNNVIGHLWQAIPGAHYKRMFGVHKNPYLYELIDQHADHYHWDNTGKWTESRDGVANDLGGGHSHCGGMIYLGDNWPDKYRGNMLMCNTHGRRVNCDVIERHGSGYIAKHAADVLLANQPWFRGVEMKYGPDGGVYLADWTDNGECHDHDGVHRTSGRIYKITYGDVSLEWSPRADTLTDQQLVETVFSENVWLRRRALRRLHERTADNGQGNDGQDGVEQLGKWLWSRLTDGPPLTVKERCRLLFLARALGGAEIIVDGEHVRAARHLDKAFEDDSDYVRSLAIRLASENGRRKTDENIVDDADLHAKLVSLATSDSSSMVRLTIASALQRLQPANRWDIADALASHSEDAGDHNLPLMIWYGIESDVIENQKRSVQLAVESKIPLLREFVSRRLASDWDIGREPVTALLNVSVRQEASFQRDVLTGVVDAFRGRRQVEPVDNWETLSQRLSMSGDKEVASLVRELSVLFGDGRAMEELWVIVNDKKGTPGSRQQALETIIAARQDGTSSQLIELLNDNSLRTTAIIGLASFSNEQTPSRILGRFAYLRGEAREAAITTLTSRPAWAIALLEATRDGKVPVDKLSAIHAQQMASLGDDKVTALLQDVWGVLGRTSEETEQLIDDWQQKLTADTLADADLANGRRLFNKTCAVCHKLYGQGGQIGPDLTGSGRHNLTYLLENIFDPNRVVPKQWTASTFLLVDGRVITGVEARRTADVVTIQTAKEEIVLPIADIEESTNTGKSLMPEGQMNILTEGEVRDLFAYLQSRGQVELSE